MTVCGAGLAVARSFALHREGCPWCDLALAVADLALVCAAGRRAAIDGAASRALRAARLTSGTLGKIAEMLV